MGPPRNVEYRNVLYGLFTLRINRDLSRLFKALVLVLENKCSMLEVNCLVKTIYWTTAELR